MKRLQRTLTESHWLPREDESVHEISLGELLAERARAHPDRIALVEGVADPVLRRRWSYQELLDTAQVAAQALLEHFEPGERIAVWSPNSAEWLLLQHGAALAGLVIVTVNPAYLARELEHVLKTSEVSGIFHVDRYRGNDSAAILASIKGQLPKLRTAISFSEWKRFMAAGRAGRRRLPHVRPDDPAQIQFTSGTTGAPKGACLRHASLINAARFGAMRVGFPEGGVWASAMPLFHVGGSSGSHIGSLSHGGTFVLQTVFDAAAMLELIETEGVQHLHAVPAMLTAMLEHPELPRRSLHTLRSVMSGGSNVSADLIRRVCRTFECRFSTNFGQTELSGVICQTFPDDPAELHAGTVGQPAPCMELKVVDPVSGRTCALGTPGEIWARGYQTMLGYINLPSSSGDALTADGWVRTGDEGCMDAEGYVRITGRLKDAIIRGGENIYPREIEEVLALHPAVRQSCVMGVPDPYWGEVVAAVVSLRKDAVRPSALDLFLYCRSQLAAYKTPGVWYFADELPLTVSGKVRKHELRQWLENGRLQPEAFERPAMARVAQAHP